ncbi:MAG: toxin-antitoxin system protein [Isosphaeraceae bacterium]
MVRVSRSAHAVLRGLTDEANESLTDVLDRVVESYRRAHFFEGLDNDFAALRRNKTAWEEERKEREAWDATLSDGLKD